MCMETAVQCDNFHMSVSGTILSLALVSFLVNLLLVLAMNNWNLKKTCKMFLFLWHLTIADALLALAFVYYHIRVLSLCPQPYK